MNHVITVLNRKGGVGKTVTVQNIGAGLMHKGYKVLYLDLDSQANLTFNFSASGRDATISDLLRQTSLPDRLIVHTENGDIIPADESLVMVESELLEKDADGNYIQPRYTLRLSDGIGLLKSKYDYIIIDTPAQMGIITYNVLMATDSLIIPVQTDTYSMQGMAILNETIQAVQKNRPKLNVGGVLITRYLPRSLVSKDVKENIEEYAKSLNWKVFNTPIRECTAVREAQVLKTDVFSYAPKSNATADYEAVINELISGRK